MEAALTPWTKYSEGSLQLFYLSVNYRITDVSWSYSPSFATTPREHICISLICTFLLNLMLNSGHSPASLPPEITNTEPSDHFTPIELWLDNVYRSSPTVVPNQCCCFVCSKFSSQVGYHLGFWCYTWYFWACRKTLNTSKKQESWQFYLRNLLFDTWVYIIAWFTRQMALPTGVFPE